MKNKYKIGSFFSISIVSVISVFVYNTLDDNVLNNTSRASQLTQVTVSAAASLKDVMEEIEPLYEKEHPSTDIIYNFASSGSLQRQIEQGAPVDVFISANTKQMDILEKQQLILTETRRDLLKNQIVLVTSENNEKNNLKVNDFKDLTTQKIGKIALGEPQSVPAGKYAQEVLKYFNISTEVNSKAVYAKDVRQVLYYVATGNVDAGVVYRTDAQISKSVKIVTIAPEDSHSQVTYPIAVIKDSDAEESGRELINFLTTPKAKAIFENYGFTALSSR